MRYEWVALALCVALAGCGQDDDSTLHGYIEADPVRVASPVGGQLLKLPVEKGDSVEAGQPLFTLEQGSERAAVSEANAKVMQARAQAADLNTGKRPDELAQIEADQKAAAAALRQSEADLARQRALAKSGFVSGANLDGYIAKRDSDAAHLQELNAQLRSGKLPGRDAQREAAQAGTTAAQADLAQKQWTLAQKTMPAPVKARVEDSYYRVGEWVPAGAPVVSLLETAAVKARFYIPEPYLAKLVPGTRVTITCDGCGAMAATVRFVARDAEYTPPLIYSKENRAKLVWMAEAVPSAADAAKLRPGQPVDVVMTR